MYAALACEGYTAHLNGSTGEIQGDTFIHVRMGSAALIEMYLHGQLRSSPPALVLSPRKPRLACDLTHRLLWPKTPSPFEDVPRLDLISPSPMWLEKVRFGIS
jgi:hypothetical protein